MLFQSQLKDLWGMMPWVSLHRRKEALRALDVQKRRIMTEEEIAEQSSKVVDIIAASRHFKEAKTVMLYFPVHNEVDLRELVRQYHDQKTFLYPSIAHGTNDMEVRVFEPHTPFHKGRFGIPQPNTSAYRGSIDMIIVPGISFDRQCNRVGRGGGFYDRFLKRYRHSYKVGVGYDFQLHKDVPHGLFDIRMNRVVTPTQKI